MMKMMRTKKLYNLRFFNVIIRKEKSKQEGLGEEVSFQFLKNFRMNFI